MALVKMALMVVLAFAMMGVGALHFVQPKAFARIVPKYLPAPLFLVYLSGFFEILGGVGLLVPMTREAAAWGLVVLYIAVFPANVNMAIHKLPLGDKQVGPWFLWIRLPMQFLLIAWAWWYT